MLLPVVIYFSDLPLHMLLQQFVTMSQSAGYLTMVLMAGAVYWFLIGMIVRALVISARQDVKVAQSVLHRTADSTLDKATEQRHHL